MLKTTKQAAQYLNVSASYLEKLRVKGGGPKFINLGRCIRYSENDLNDFKNEHRRGSTSEMLQ